MERLFWKIYFRILGVTQAYIFVGVKWYPVCSFLAGILTILSLILEPLAPLGYLSTPAAAIGIFLFILDVYKIATSTDRYNLLFLNASELDKISLSEKYFDYQIVQIDNVTYIFDPIVNQMLSTTPMGLGITKTKYSLPKTARDFAAFILIHKRKPQSILFNQKKVRLTSDLIYDDLRRQTPIRVQPTYYYSSICTNEITCNEIIDMASKSQVYNGFSFMSSEGILLDLEESLCSNHIGIGSLAFTLDNKIIITMQTSGAFIDSNLLLPSCSGSADWKDTYNAKTLQEFVVRAMNRELTEECGLSKNIPIRTVIMGYARIINRGGKPEFYGVSFIDEISSNVKITNKEALFIADLGAHKINMLDIEILRKSLRQIKEKYQSKFASDLHMCFYFLDEYLGRSPEAFIQLSGKSVT